MGRYEKLLYYIVQGMSIACLFIAEQLELDALPPPPPPEEE